LGESASPHAKHDEPEHGIDDSRALGRHVQRQAAELFRRLLLSKALDNLTGVMRQRSLPRHPSLGAAKLQRIIEKRKNGLRKIGSSSASDIDKRDA
jgi:hypothetical protein